MGSKTEWHKIDLIKPSSGEILWVWDGVSVSLAVCFRPWVGGSVEFCQLDQFGTVRNEIQGVVLWTRTVTPEAP